MNFTLFLIGLIFALIEVALYFWQDVRTRLLELSHLRGNPEFCIYLLGIYKKSKSKYRQYF